jgi:hypothetical protein
MCPADHEPVRDGTPSALGAEPAAEDTPPACLGCKEPIREIVPNRPEYCFICAVHVVCACADEPG